MLKETEEKTQLQRGIEESAIENEQCLSELKENLKFLNSEKNELKKGIQEAQTAEIETESRINDLVEQIFSRDETIANLNHEIEEKESKFHNETKLNNQQETIEKLRQDLLIKVNNHQSYTFC